MYNMYYIMIINYMYLYVILIAVLRINNDVRTSVVLICSFG